MEAMETGINKISSWLAGVMGYNSLRKLVSTNFFTDVISHDAR